jgi:transcriptional regulator with XRE-family HTH domain
VPEVTLTHCAAGTLPKRGGNRLHTRGPSGTLDAMTAARQLHDLSTGLALARAQSGRGVRDVARAAFVSPGTVRNTEAGAGEPSYRQAARIAYALGLRLELSIAGLRRGRPNPFFELHGPKHWFLPRDTEEPRPASANADDFAWECLRVIATQIWWRRRQAGWSDEAAARAWGLSPKTLRRLEYGEDWPSLRALTTVAEHLGADLVLAPALSDWRPMPWQRAAGTWPV